MLAPAVALLNKRSLTVTYDITPMVRKGNNEIRLWLGKGWYRRNLGFAQYDGRFNGHIAGGLVGTAIFTQWAILQGQSQPEPSQLVYNMLKQRSYPGYLYMIDNNATTTWEYWNGERSHVHNCYNGIGLWFYQALGGIRPTDDGVGYQRVIIAPQCPKDVTWATTTRQTPYGLLRTEWRGSQLKAQIPVGVEAEVVWRGKRHIVGSGEWTF